MLQNRNGSKLDQKTKDRKFRDVGSQLFAYPQKNSKHYYLLYRITQIYFKKVGAVTQMQDFPKLIAVVKQY